MESAFTKELGYRVENTTTLDVLQDLLLDVYTLLLSVPDHLTAVRRVPADSPPPRANLEVRMRQRVWRQVVTIALVL